MKIGLAKRYVLPLQYSQNAFLIAFVLKQNLKGKIFMTNRLNMWSFVQKKYKTIFKLI